MWPDHQRDGLVPIKFDIGEKEEDHLIAEIMKIYYKIDDSE